MEVVPISEVFVYCLFCPLTLNNGAFFLVFNLDLPILLKTLYVEII